MKGVAILGRYLILIKHLQVAVKCLEKTMAVFRSACVADPRVINLKWGRRGWYKVRWLFLAQCLTKTGKKNWTSSCFSEKGVAILARY